MFFATASASNENSNYLIVSFVFANPTEEIFWQESIQQTELKAVHHFVESESTRFLTVLVSF